MRFTMLGLLLASATFAAEIPKGSHALLRLVNSISTRTAREGDYVYLRTATPIVSGGVVLVPVDSYVQGIVIHPSAAGASREWRNSASASRRSPCPAAR